MAVNYREVNMQFEPTANQLPYQPSFFQRLDGHQIFAKVDNLWGYHQLRLAEDSSKIAAIRLVSLLPCLNIRIQEWRMRF